MEISNLLILPGDKALATEVMLALRYEKTARLFCPETRAPDGMAADAITNETRVTFTTPLPPIEKAAFPAALPRVMAAHDIHYLIPTTDEARQFFKNAGAEFPVLDTVFDVEIPSKSHATAIVLDCYSDKKGGLVFCGARLKTIGSSAFWQNAPATDEQIILAQDICSHYGMSGAWSVSIEQNSAGHWIARKITPHLTPELALCRALGVNFILLMLHEARGNIVSALPVTATVEMATLPITVCTRLPFKSVFLDLDDTLLVQDSVNSSIVAFAEECSARHIPITLITRHYRDPALTLKEKGIESALFSTIVWITDNTPKSHYMKDADSPIFIDDAFSERREVCEHTDVPCFPPDVVDALLSGLE